MDNMSADEKRRAAGQGNYFCASLFCCIAFICGMNAAWACSFLEREVVLSENFTADCMAAEISEDVCNALTETQGIGFYGFEVTVPVDQRLCLGYTQHIEGVGYVTPDFDTKFNSAKAFTVVANVFGGVAFLTLWLASCCAMSQERIKGLSCHFFIATFFQGLTFLIYRSVVCHRGFFSEYFQGMETDEDGIPVDILDVNCSLGSGGKLAIVATVFYFLCLNMIPTAVPPTPLGMRENAAGTTEPEAATEEPFTEEPKTAEP
eukprot:CAMPEP_0198302950 /NCGR_PEP_ID=MMETSP1449-20131203/56633_1 /TAXON_ID=420275 /ORGANISM="Attheya septentrionalis, Strain CCMP2084" /LENGTH=261 /DNA_ID=CAMNT_0044005429 /DNA_START=1316 /DNA_END=2101 /DNA_ORIENTATION=-